MDKFLLDIMENEIKNQMEIILIQDPPALEKQLLYALLKNIHRGYKIITIEDLLNII